MSTRDDVNEWWPAGYAMLERAELEVKLLARSRRFWKVGPRDPVSLVRAEVAAAFQARNIGALRVALYWAAVHLPRLRPLGRAMFFLSWWLEDEPEPVARLLRDATRAAGVSPRTLRRAKHLLKLEAVRRGGWAGAGHWEWQHLRRPENAPKSGHVRDSGPAPSNKPLDTKRCTL
jgi:hypothetical protein